jgi:hypothetical protein
MLVMGAGWLVLAGPRLRFDRKESGGFADDVEEGEEEEGERCFIRTLSCLSW